MNTALALAAVLSLGTALLHVVAGGREVATSLLEADMPPVPKFTAYYCWHMVSIVLVAMAGSYAYAAAVPDGRDVAVLTTGLSLAFAAWSVWLVITTYRHPFRMPHWALFLAIGGSAAYGLV